MSNYKNGKPAKFHSGEGHDWINPKTGNVVILLNPNEKSRKYAVELKHGYAKTNRNETKRTKDGKGIKLTKAQRAYRAGYLDRGKDNANCFNAKKKKR